MGIFVKKVKKYHDAVYIQRKTVLETENQELANLALAGLDCDWIPNARGSFGRFFRNPIVTNGINGTLAYLGKLVVEKYKTGLIFHKIGSIPNSLTGVGKIDIYEVMDESANHWDILFVDMYHPRRSNLAPEGYYLKEYNRETGDTNQSLGTVEVCSSFPNRIASSLMSSANIHYSIVKDIINELTEGGKPIIAPEEHKKKVNAIKEILAQQSQNEQ